MGSRSIRAGLTDQIGTVTQPSAITAAVSLSALSGQITTATTTLGAGADATFTVTNSEVTSDSFVVCHLASTSNAGTPLVFCSAVADGTFDITVSNLHASTAFDGNTMVINFLII
jgi:hypothetical protein